MSLTLKHLTRLRSLHQRIKTAQTGTPIELAKSMHISERTLREDLKLIKNWGGKICYDRKSGTYYYCSDFELKINFEVTAITAEEKRIIFGERSRKTFVANKLP